MSTVDENCYGCDCGDSFAHREQLIEHGVSAHGRDEGDSRRAVLERYSD